MSPKACNGNDKSIMTKFSSSRRGDTLVAHRLRCILFYLPLWKLPFPALDAMNRVSTLISLFDYLCRLWATGVSPLLELLYFF